MWKNARKGDLFSPARRKAALWISMLVVAGLGLLGASNSATTTPSASDSGLTVEARSVVAGKEGHKVLRIVATLINHTSKDVVVLTQCPEKGLSQDAIGLVMDFSFTGRQVHKGRLLIPSLYPMAPVTLRPDEATQLVAQFTGRWVEPVHQGTVIRVQYKVSDEWGKRFDIWHGLTATEATVKAVADK